MSDYILYIMSDEFYNKNDLVYTSEILDNLIHLIPK